jgi:hypothetical protein
LPLPPAPGATFSFAAKHYNQKRQQTNPRQQDSADTQYQHNDIADETGIPLLLSRRGRAVSRYD